MTRGVVAAAAVATLGGALLQGTASASPPPAHDGNQGTSAKHRHDDLPDPKESKRRANKREALEKVLRGEVKTERRGESNVVKLGKGRYAQMSAPKTDQLFTILCEFGDQTDPRTGGEAGPVRNEIPAPDQKVDNSTYWEKDFSQDHFKKMFFGKTGESFADFYLKQSSGKYTVDGDVSAWVKVPYNEARYGSNEIPESDAYWNFVKDCSTAWFDNEKAQGKTDEEIKQYLATFDKWDRFDFDADGNFDEADGYIDHIQLIHAGEGEEAGGGAQGEDAIWSHRWSAFPNDATGPEFNQSGGTPIGDSGIFVRDYTTEPENGGLGVFAHEYGHDLGLPDLYDTQGGENGTGFWSLMSAGSWLGHGKGTIGTTPGYMGAWEKLQLGWLDYEVAVHDDTSKHTLGVAERTTANPQALVVVLPEKKVVTDYNKPASGEYEWWSGEGDELNNTLARSVDLTGATGATLSAKAWYDTEEGYDFGYVEASTDGGASWEKVGDPIDGSSDEKWTDLSYDLSAYAGKEVEVRFRYASDANTHGAGIFLDDFAVKAGDETVFSDDVESGTNGWTARGFTRMTGTNTEMKGRYYLAENRQYVDYDRTLKTGPYLYGHANSKPDWVQQFPYQNGLLITYWDETQADNNTSVHPGKGLVLPVDAHYKPITFSDGSLLSNRRQPFDATFGVERTDPIRLSNEVQKGEHWQVVVANVKAQPAVRTFDDSKPNAYWSGKNPQHSVKVAGVGVKIQVTGQTGGGNTMKVRVVPAK
ncbi:MAG: M6 family metalloprotease domain-containing protein [Streptosporangiales bacterium]|nr:M6 family metalloprotease domain-containing protein [Streptosporangiales bacterium]